ncbi:hypothetical protein BT93_F2769 [Corymbia citriodora subsp. variegata]|nr:hypothetical protein BT93_F2769 [Corymbia citriodora subsp. variegata]
MEKRCIGPFMLLLLVLAPRSNVSKLKHTTRDHVMSDINMCHMSHKFHGPRMCDRTCVVVCKEEGFDDGKCRGFRHRCFCCKPC